jgi:N-methylhydantoinase A/oxoprolinase/acetone carboxylase beta subunit
VYPGQTFDVAIPCERPSSDPAFLRAAVGEFHRRYEEARLIEARAQEPVFRGLRLVATGLVDQPEPVRLESATAALEPVSRRRLYTGGTWTHDAPVHDGEAWRPGPELVGPAVVQFRFTTLVLRPGDRTRVLPGGDVMVDVAPLA